MREVITISLPKEFASKIRTNAKKRGMAISHYVIHSIKAQESMISEDDIITMSKELKSNKKIGIVFSGIDTLKNMYENK